MNEQEVNHKRRCQAMAEAGIEDPDSTEGIVFCAGTRDGKIESQCPYSNCIVFEATALKAAAKERADFAKKLSRHGVSVKDITLILGVSITTVRGYLKK